MKTTTKTRGRPATRSASTGNNGGRAPHGTNVVFNAWLEAMSGRPTSSQIEVGKAFMSKAREHLATLKAAAKADRGEPMTATRRSTRTTKSGISKGTIKRATKGTSKAGTTRRRSSIIATQPVAPAETAIATDGLIN